MLFKLREKMINTPKPVDKCLELECTSGNQKTCHSSMRKHSDADHDVSESPPTTSPVIFVEVFTALLTRLAPSGNIYCCTHVPMDVTNIDDSTSLGIIT